MNQILKFSKDQKIIFVSDFHINHDRDFLLQPRFDALPVEIKSRYEGSCWTVDDHKNWIKEQWDHYVDEDTIVFNLGDVCFNDSRGNHFEDISKWKCKDHYVLDGNHLSGHKQVYEKALEEKFFSKFQDLYPSTSRSRREVEVYPLQYNNVTFVGRELTIRVGKQEICLSHFPKRIWDHSGRGSFSLSAHSHSNDIERNPKFPFHKALDVGVENAIIWGNKFCFTYEDVVNIMATKEIKQLDHHDENTNPS